MAYTYAQPYAKHHYAEGYIVSTFEEAIGTFNLSTKTKSGTSGTTANNFNLSRNSRSEETRESYTDGNQKLKRSYSSSSGKSSSHTSQSERFGRLNNGGGNTTSSSVGNWVSATGNQYGTYTQQSSQSGSFKRSDASTSTGATRTGAGGETVSRSFKENYNGTTNFYGYTSTFTSSYTAGQKVKIYDPTSKLAQRNQTGNYVKTVINDSTVVHQRGASSIVGNSTKDYRTRATKYTGGSPASIYPSDETVGDSDDPNNGAGTPYSNAYNIPKLTHKSSIGNTEMANYEVQYTDTETVSTEFYYTVKTFGESKHTTTSSTSRRTTNTKSPNWTHPYEPFNITQTIETYITESVETTSYNATRKESIISGPAAYMTGGDILENGLVVGDIQTVTSVLFPIPIVEFIEYTSDGQSGGGIQNATRFVKTKSVTNHQILKYSNSEISAELSKYITRNNESFWFGNISNVMAKGDTVTRNQFYAEPQANTNSRVRDYIYEQENFSEAFNVSSSGSHTILTTYYRSYLASDQKLSFSEDTNATTRSFGAFTSYRNQDTMREDGNTIVRSRATSPTKTTVSAMTVKEPVRSLSDQIYSDYGRGTRGTVNAYMSGAVFTADKNYAYGGYQKEYTSIVSDAGKEYGGISIGDEIIETDTIYNSNVASIDLTINSAVSNTYASSWNFPFMAYSSPLRLNKYFIFIPESSYGNIYTSVQNGSVSFEHSKNNESHIIYQYGKTYTTTVSANSSQVFTIKTDKSLMDGLVKVGNAANFGNGVKTQYSEQGGRNYLQSHQQCFGGKTFTNESGFSFANGYPVNSYLFYSDGSSSILASSSNTVSTEGNATVSLPPTGLLFTFLPVGIDSAQNNDATQRVAADFRSTRD
jgi:hypothetical protein